MDNLRATQLPGFEQEVVFRTRIRDNVSLAEALSRGQDRVSANELFRKTDNTETSKSVNTQDSKDTSTETHEPVRKQYVFAYDLSEKLRELAFRERRKEVDIVRDALAEYLEKRLS